MTLDRLQLKTAFLELARLSHAVRRLLHRGVIRNCGIALLALGLAGLAPPAVAQSFPAVFELSSLSPAAGGDGTEGFVLRGIDTRDSSGISVSNAGDVNGDGIDDFIIGAFQANPNGKNNAGESYVVFGRTTAFPAAFELSSLLPAAGGNGAEGFVLKGIEAGDESGISVSSAGDVNGDGIDDFIIGAYRADLNELFDVGESYVIFGRTTSFPAAFELRSLLPEAGGDGTGGFVLKGIDSGDNSGYSVSGAGDINGDGIDDFFIGANDAAPQGESEAGESYVVFGRTTGFPAVFQLRSLFPEAGGDGTGGFVIKGIDELDNSGFSVSGASDVNGDGINDFIIGAVNADPNGAIDAGESYVVFGRRTDFPAAFELRSLLPAAGGDGTEGFVLKGIDADDASGVSVSGAGDINGDGVDDLIIGAQFSDANGANGAGESYVVFGRTTGFPAAFQLRSLFPEAGGNGTEGFVLKGINTFDESGQWVKGAGDVNGDGIDDLIIGAWLAKGNAGETYVVFGRRAGFPAAFQLRSLLPAEGGDGTEGFVLEGINFVDYSGISVSGAGDVNGDGIDDFIIGAKQADPNGASSAGESYVVFGRNTGFPATFELSSLLPTEGGDGTAGFALMGIRQSDSSGYSVSNAGDINGDGIDDFIIGAPSADPNGTNGAGESYVIFGRAP